MLKEKITEQRLAEILTKSLVKDRLKKLEKGLELCRSEHSKARRSVGNWHILKQVEIGLCSRVVKDICRIHFMKFFGNVASSIDFCYHLTISECYH